MEEEVRKQVMENIREDAARLRTWSEDWIVYAVWTAGKDLRAIRDGLDRIIRGQELASKGEAK